MMHSGAIRGVLWMLVMTLVSNLNDVIMKFIGQSLPAVEVAFFRFFFGVFTMVPVMLYLGRNSFVAKNWSANSFRTILGFVAIMMWCYGVTQVNLSTATSLGFTLPFFALPLAVIFLQERVGMRRWLSTGVGFIGIWVIVKPGAEHFHMASLILLGSSLIFASSDIIGKKMVGSESVPAILFYFGLGASVLALGPALYTWVEPTLLELGLLLVLGVGCNLIQLCALKAFQSADISLLAPFRYVELFIAILTGWLFFGERLTLHTAIGASMIVASTLYLTYAEISAVVRLPEVENP